jgi:hypothetical protein
MDGSIRSKFMALVRDEDLADPSWILRLDAFDEPPLFSRSGQVEFLRPLAEAERVVATLDIMLALIEQIADEAARCAMLRTFFVCATFSDFDSWRAGEQLVPTPAIYVNPNEGELTPSGLRLVEPHSVEGKAVAQWLVQLGPPRADQYCVGELSAETFDPELKRVYVGWRTDPFGNVRSVGSEISTAKPSGLDV